MQFVALDLGSSTIKGALLDLDQLAVRTIQRATCPPKIGGLGPGCFELDPLAIVDIVEQQVLAPLMHQADSCAGLVACGQMGGVVLVDQTSTPQSNYISWRDERTLFAPPDGSDPSFHQTRELLGEPMLEQLGGECKPGTYLPLLCWLHQANQLKQDTTPLSLGDFVLRRLGAEAVTEPTNALGAIDLRTREWHADAIGSLDLPPLNWPPLFEFSRPIGNLAGNIFGAAGPPTLFPCVGDHQCSLVGAMLQEDELSINASTGSQVSVLSRDYDPGDHQVRPFFESKFLKTLTHLPAGRSLNVIVDLLTEVAIAQDAPLDNPWPYILRQADQSDSDLQVDLAFFDGPMGDRGSIGGVSVDNLTVGRLFRAAFRNMSANYRTCATRLASDHSWRQLALSGGLVRQSAALRDEIRMAFAPAPVRIVETAEETLQGLMLLAMVASGRASDLSDAISQLAARQRD